MLELAQRYRCIPVDMRGTGDSDKPFSAYTFEESCSDLKALISQLDLSDVALVGWSARGGAVALQYVLDFNQDHRVSRVVIVGATPRFIQTDTEPWGVDQATATQLLEGVRRGWPEMLADLGKAGFHRTDLEATGEWIMRLTLKAPVYAGYRLLKALFDVDLRHRLGEVDVPTLILHGRHDQTCDPRWAEYMADRIDRAKLVWFEESAHYPMVEEPDKLSTEIAGFLQ